MRRPLATERLEHRHLPSVALPGIVATDPGDGATVLRGVQAFTITFDSSVVDQIETAFADMLSVDPGQVLPTIIASDLGQDVEIDRVGADGTVTPYAGGSAAATVQESIATTTAADGTTETQLVVSLPAGSPSMPAGTYQIDMLPLTTLDLAFASVADPSWFNFTDPLPIAQFAVEDPGPTLAGATDLGTIGAAPQQVWGSIQPADAQAAVALYRFTLPQGGPWQLDAQVLANAFGSRLPPVLTLFGPDGTVIALRDTGTGSDADPIDPVLVKDLPGGTYYLGVSAAGNRPETAHGYDPITGKPGSGGVDDPPGVYELEVSATPAAPPTTLVGFTLDHADPLEPSPTGLDLTFSGPVDATPLTPPDHQETEVNVVDASGRTWPITYVGASGPDGLSFLIDEPLPAGTYSLEVPPQGGLTDLAGNVVDGPAGEPGGVLATWTVAAPSGPADPNNLGVLWPGPEYLLQPPAISRSDAVGPGQSIDDRFVVPGLGRGKLLIDVGTGSIDVRIVSADGSTILDVSDSAGKNGSYFYASEGIYYLQMTAEGSEPSTVAWQLQFAPISWEKIAASGVGQLPAQSFELIVTQPGNPSAFAGPVSSGPAPSSGMATVVATSAGPATGSTPAGTGSGDVASSTGRSSASGIPAGLLVTPEATLAGLPTSGGWHATTIGPLADGAAVALADAGRGLPAGLRYESSSGTDPRVGGVDPPSGPAPMVRRSDAGTRPAPGSEAASARVDAIALALAQADPMVRIAGWLAGRLPGPPATPVDPETIATDLGTTLLAAAAPTADADGTGRDRGRDTLAQADLGVPFALLVGTALTYRFSQPIRKWWRRYHVAHPTWPRPYGFARNGLTVGRR